MHAIRVTAVLLFVDLIAANDKQTNDFNCMVQCDNTYFGKQQSDIEALFSCHRGCRLFNLIDLSQRNKDETVLRYECNKACSEAYIDDKLNKSCSFGCDHQTSLRKELDLFASPFGDKQWSIWPFHHLKFESIFNDEDMEQRSPFRLFNSILNKLRSSSFWAHSKPSVTFYTQGSNGNVKVIHYKSEAFQTQTAANAPEVVVHSYSVVENGDSNDLRNDISVKEIELKPEIRHHHLRSDSDHRKSWFSCFTYQTAGIPRWILVLILSLAIVALAWICCATTVTAPTHRIKRHFGFGKDLPFIILREDGNEVPTQKGDIYWRIFGNTGDLKKQPLNVFDSPPPYDEASKPNPQSGVESTTPIKKS